MVLNLKIGLAWSTIVLFMVVLVTSTIHSTNGAALGDQQPLNLLHLGVVEGKAFLAELNLNMSWSAARAYCRSNKLELAAVETEVQFNFIQRALDAVGNQDDTGLWIAARESRQPTMLVWDDTQRHPDTSFRRWEFVRPEYAYHFCSQYAYWENNGSMFFTLPCDELKYVLCQG